MSDAKVIQLVNPEVDHFAAYRIVSRVYFSGSEVTSAAVDTAIGKVSTSTTCRVLIECPEDWARKALTSTQAREIARALNHAARMADQREEHVRGDTVRKVRITDGVVSVKTKVGFDVVTMPMRLQKTRVTRRNRSHQCNECRLPVTESWASYRITDKGWGPKPRVGEVRICKECLPKLVVDNAVVPILIEGEGMGPRKTAAKRDEVF